MIGPTDGAGGGGLKLGRRSFLNVWLGGGGLNLRHHKCGNIGTNLDNPWQSGTASTADPPLNFVILFRAAQEMGNRKERVVWKLRKKILAPTHNMNGENNF